MAATMTFWLMMCLTFGLVSVATLSPIPLIIVFVVWVLSRPFEKPLVDEVIRTGVILIRYLTL